MAITLIEYKKKRSGTRYNPDKKCYTGYRIDVWINNVRYRNKRFPTRADAEKYIDSLKLKNTYSKHGLKFNEKTKIPRVSEVFEKRSKLIKNKLERIRAKRVFAFFQEIIETDLLITEVRTSHFRQFNAQKLETGVKPETVNRDINTLSPAFKSASEMFPEILEDFQPPRIPRLKVKRSTGRTRVITEREKNLICDYLRKPKTETETPKEFANRLRIGRMFELAWLLGLRFKEIAKLKKTDFNFKQRTLNVIRYKTDSATFFEFLPEFICHKIKEATEASETAFIYTISGNYPKDFYPILKEAVESNGMIYGRKEKDGITFHSNRHSFTTRLVQNTDLATAQNFTGLSTKELLGYYAHATDESKQAAFASLYNSEKRELGLSELHDIFEKVKQGKMDLVEFCEMLSSNKIEVLDSNRTQNLRLVK